MKKADSEEDEHKPDPLTQLVTTFCRGAMTERSGALQEDPLYMSYAEITAKYVDRSVISTKFNIYYESPKIVLRYSVSYFFFGITLYGPVVFDL